MPRIKNEIRITSAREMKSSATLQVVLRARGLYEKALESMRPYGVSLNDVVDSSHDKSASLARDEIAWMLRQDISLYGTNDIKLTGLSYPAIGRLLNRDHTTIIKAVARAEARRK